MRKTIIVMMIFCFMACTVPAVQAMDKAEFASRRAKFMDQIGEEIAIFLGATTPAADNRFFQNNDFYYFTGVEIPNAYLIIDGLNKESLLFFSMSEDEARGEGLPPELVRNPVEQTGIERVYPLERFSAILSRLILSREAIHTSFKPGEINRVNSNEKFNALQRSMTLNIWDGRLTRELQFVKQLKEKFPHITVRDSSTLIWDMRKIKSASEIDLIRQAAQLGVGGHRAVIKATAPGVKEKELAALFQYTCMRKSAMDLAYNVIFMSGPNHAFGHYHKHDRTLADGDFIILDAGPDVGYYNADVSTTFPANGKFSPKQKEIYELAYGIYKTCLDNYRPGITFQDVGEKVRQHLIEKGHDPEERRFRGFIRYGGYNHSIGMATHDVMGTFAGPDEVLRPGFVFACDINMPYADQEMGIRIEDTVVITENGYENLSRGLPRSLEEIEAFMNNNKSAQEIDVYQRPIQQERTRDYDVQHYRIALTFDLDKKSFWGENRITLVPLKNNLRECSLDAEELTVTGVYTKDRTPLRYTQTDKQIVIQFAKSYDYGQEITFSVEYNAQNPQLGLYFDDETASHPQMVSVASWPDRAHHWIPCYDYPHDKATHDTIITVSDRLQVLSNGRLISVEDNTADETKTFHWQQDLPHSTYLYTLAIGPFVVIEDSLGSLPVNSWVYKKDLEDGRWIFEKTPYMIEFFNKTFGYEYPWAKHGQFTTPRVGGGMENTTATGLGESVIHDRRAEQDFSWETTIAHEVAHQWWGNLITLRTWSETWLNESFGTYSDYLYTRYDKGEDEGALALLNKKNAYLREAHNRYIRPIVFERYNRPQDNFDSHTYPKGACVLHMLRFILGDKPFFATLSHFLHKHEFQAVDTHDFQVAVKEATGQNMDWFFDMFIYKPGHPVFDVSYSWDKDTQKLKIRIIQVQDTTLGIPIYTLPVVIGIVTAESDASKEVWIKKKEEVFEFPVQSKPLLVRFDKGNYLLKEWTFEKDLDELLYQLGHDDVIGRMWAATELSRFKDNPHTPVALAKQAAEDPFWAVRRECVGTLGKIGRMEDIELLKTTCSDNNSKVRTAALFALGERKRSEHVSFFIFRFEKDDSYLAQAEALRSIAKCGGRSQLSFLENAARMTSPRNVIKRAADWAIDLIKKRETEEKR